jgi:hypothetical protein
LLPANEYTLRAAIITCAKTRGSELKIYRADRRILLGSRERSGWIIYLATDGSKPDKVAVRDRPGYANQRIKARRWRLAFGNLAKGQFDDAETEQILRAFLGGNGSFPEFVRWVELE